MAEQLPPSCLPRPLHGRAYTEERPRVVDADTSSPRPEPRPTGRATSIARGYEVTHRVDAEEPWATERFRGPTQEKLLQTPPRFCPEANRYSAEKPCTSWTFGGWTALASRARGRWFEPSRAHHEPMAGRAAPLRLRTLVREGVESRGQSVTPISTRRPIKRAWAMTEGPKCPARRAWCASSVGPGSQDMVASIASHA